MLNRKFAKIGFFAICSRVIFIFKIETDDTQEKGKYFSRFKQVCINEKILLPKIIPIDEKNNFYPIFVIFSKKYV